jgi:hypothetical protein
MARRTVGRDKDAWRQLVAKRFYSGWFRKREEEGVERREPDLARKIKRTAAQQPSGL